MNAPTAGWDDAYRAGVVKNGTDPVAAAAEQSGQDERKFDKHVLFRASRSTNHHGCRSVEDEPCGQFAIFVELASLRFVEPGGDVPVDVPGIVALDIGPQPVEVESPPPPWGSVTALKASVESPHDPPLQLEQQTVRRLSLLRGVRGVVPPAALSSPGCSTTPGTGTARSTRIRMLSASRSSASASYDNTIRCRRTSSATSSTSCGNT